MTPAKVTTRVQIVPYQSPLALYTKLSRKGNDISLLFESKSANQKYERKSIIITSPALKIEGKEEHFTITALNNTGKKVLAQFTAKDLPFTTNIHMQETTISGMIQKQDNPNMSAEEKSTLTNPADLIKMILAKFNAGDEYAGLYGIFAYDFARNYYRIQEKLPKGNTNDFTLFLPTQALILYDDGKRAEPHKFSYGTIPYKKEQGTKGYTFVTHTHGVAYDISDEEYKKSAHKAITDIAHGRAMQCVLSQSTTSGTLIHPLQSYETLREINPSPYSFYYNLGNNEIVYGASPEMHIKIDVTPHGRKIYIRPIAGTIQRSTNPLDDAEARKQLLTDEKELREHTMLVDLARHELYSLSEPHSVTVTDLYTLETYPNLYHLVSGVEGIMKKDKNAIDALLITIPAGTLSGAPKQEAMNMIEELEKSRRGYYGGASGLVSFNGACNSGITIRSVHVKDNTSTIRGGAGITYLSKPEQELREVKLKISKAQKALEVAP